MGIAQRVRPERVEVNKISLERRRADQARSVLEQFRAVHEAGLLSSFP